MTRRTKAENDTLDDRLKFAVDFVNIDLSKKRPGAIIDIREDIYSFLVGKKDVDSNGYKEVDIDLIGALYAPWDEYQSIDKEKLVELQRHVKLFLMDCLSLTLKTINTRQVYCFEKVSVSPWVGKTESGKAIIMVSSSIIDCFMFELVYLLRLQSIQRIFICPECGKLFVKKGRKEFCSRSCVVRANKRSWRQDPENRDKEKKWDVERFEKQKSLKKKDGKK